MLSSLRYLGTLMLVPLFTVANCGVSSGYHIHWADFIRFNGILYLRQSATIGRALRQTDLGSKFATVQIELEGHETNPSHDLRDGDAAYLPAGTPIYTVNGYQPTFLLRREEPSRWAGTL